MSNFKNLSTLLLLIFITSCSVVETKTNDIKSSPKIEPSTKPLSTIQPSEQPTPIKTPSVVLDVRSQITERQTIVGKVYDINNKVFSNVLVSAKSVEFGINWVGKPFVTANDGAYIFKDVPVGVRIEITASKESGTKRIRSEVASEYSGRFDFGFDGTTDSTDPNDLYALQNEPEIISLKINDKIIRDSATGVINKTKSPQNADDGVINNYLPTETGVSSDNLKVEMVFSEPVNKEDVENYFRIISTSGEGLKPIGSGSFTGLLSTQKSIIIDKKSPTVTFDWSEDGTKLTFKTNKGILANSYESKIEARYLIDFSQPFRDLNGLPAIPNRFFRFSASKIGGFSLFSVKSKVQNPIITNFTAINDMDGSDFLKLKFNVPMDVIGRSALSAILSDPKVSPPVIYNNLESLSNDKSTLLGYHDEKSKKFIPVYHLAIIKQNKKTTSAPLNIDNGRCCSGSNLVKSAFVDSKNLDTIIIDLPKLAFEKNDIIILSAGRQLSGMYAGNKTNNFSSLDFKTGIPLPSSNNFEEITDPAGKTLDRNGLIFLDDFSISNAQKIATAG